MPSARTAVRKEQLLVFGRLACFEVGEVSAETGPRVDFHQQIGDPDPREHAAGRVDQRLRRGGYARFERCDFQAHCGDHNPRQLAVGR